MQGRAWLVSYHRTGPFHASWAIPEGLAAVIRGRGISICTTERSNARNQRL